MPRIKVLILTALLTLSLPALAGNFSLKSPSIKHDDRLTTRQEYQGHGCTGANLSPALAWRSAPAGTKSFAVTLFDTDARAGQGWWHWTVVDIPPSIHALLENTGNISGQHLPTGAVQIPSSFGTAAYGGPCPPVGDKAHHYVFTVYALKIAKLDLPANATAATLNPVIQAHAIGKASFTARFGR